MGKPTLKLARKYDKRLKFFLPPLLTMALEERNPDYINPLEAGGRMW